MKQSLFLFLILSGMLTFCGCSKMVYTHQQVMQSYHTKSEVEKKFGIPDQKKVDNGFEEWTYNMGKPATGAAMRNDTTHNTDYIPTAADSLKINRYIASHGKYVKFIFDSSGNVSGYKSNGVDLTTTKKDNFGTGLLKVLGVTAAIVVIVGLEIANNSDINL